MKRPWKETPKDVAEEGPYAGYHAFERWFREFIDSALPDYEDYILDSLTGGQKAILYNRLSAAFDQTSEPEEDSSDSIAAAGEAAFEAGGQEWADWNMANNPFGD